MDPAVVKQGGKRPHGFAEICPGCGSVHDRHRRLFYTGASHWRFKLEASRCPSSDCHAKCVSNYISPMQIQSQGAPISGLPIRKSTRLLTNSSIVASAFDHVYCQCCGPHKTIQGSEGPYKLSKHCEQYPAELCDALLIALNQQLDQR